MTTDTEDRPASKVARLIDEYRLEGVGATLETRWTGDGVDRMSLRDLADYFNKQILEERLLQAGMPTLESELETTYTALTSDDISVGVQTETRSRLTQNDIDIETLQSDFVTYQAIRSYLQDYRDATYEGPSDEEKIAADKENIQRLLSRTHSVTEDRIETLRDTDRLAIDEFEVFVDVQVLCKDCGTQHTVGDLLEHGGCNCHLE
jgi:hypothetical protein